MTKVKMKSLGLGEFDKVERLINGIGKSVATRTLVREAERVKEDLKAKIMDSTVSWGTGIEAKKAAENLADSISVEPGEGNVRVTFKDGTHPETGKSYKQTAIDRDKASPFLKDIADGIEQRKSEIGEAVLKDQTKVLLRGLGK